VTKLKSITALMTAVVQEQDADLAQHSVEELGLPVVHFSSAGGFLGRRNATLLIGLTNGSEEKVVGALKSACRQRIEYLAIPLEGSPLPMPTPVPVTVGGATIFTSLVERFEEF
jgi:uncharacterized protein YaaQ